ncbi:uncharacterized protein C17orf104 homolog isoform X1 [Poecilia latipinna]|uniref:uncharacterized protein C17orf104 homolog isoform X1 n=2 Tax=Poecilia latipinna TaxID=48699 RepID=UPI00072ED005|nr:PREDICTED: uncharacterized protein C17orf104 homolog isoform X1 [Poecilia latipinna]
MPSNELKNRPEFRMAFDGHQTTLGNSLFQPCQRQTGVNVGGKSGCMSVPFIPNPVPSRCELSDVSWSQESQDDQYELRYTQTAIKNRKQTDTNCDAEADLQGLVSNILDEADSQDNFYSESLPTCNPIWSPKTLKEELLQYFQPEPKTFNNPSFIPNHLPHEAFSKTQQPVDKEVNELSQLSSGLAGNQQWSFNSPNGGSYSIRPQKLPPGLPLSNKVAADLSQQYKHISMPPYNSRGNDAPSKNVPVLSDIFRPQKDANASCLDDLCEDHYNPKTINPFLNDRCVPEDMNQLVSSFRSFMPSDHGSGCCGDFPGMHKPTVDMVRGGGLAQQCRKPNDPTASTQNFPPTQTQKELFGHLEQMQNGRIGDVRKQNFKLDDFQDLPEFSSERMEYFQKPKPFPAHLTFPNQHKMIMHVDNHNHQSMNQYSKYYTRQSQKKIKPQMEKENKMMQMPGFTGEGFSRRQQTNAHLAEGDKQRFSQNPYFDFQGNMQSQRRDGENIMISPGNMQQFTPLPYSLNDFRRYSSMAMNSNLSSRSILPCENRGPHMDMNGMRSTNDAAFSSFISDMKNHRGESTYHGMASALTASLMMNQEGPAFQIHFYLDECYEQFRSLEKERKKAEVILKKAFPGKRAAVMTNTNPPKTPPKSTRVDYLIVNQMKEQAKVASLFDRMECLCGVPLHINIHAALKTHHMAVCITQSRRKEDSGNMTKQQQQGINFTEDRDNPLMVMALKELAATTKRLRTALWCALQSTLPKAVKTQEHDVDEEAACAEGVSSPFLGYSFCL